MSLLKSTGLRAVIDDAQELIRSVGDESEDRYSSTRARVADTLDEGKALTGATRDATWRKMQQAFESADGFVSHSPWKAAALALGVGLAVALLATLGARSARE